MRKITVVSWLTLLVVLCAAHTEAQDENTKTSEQLKCQKGRTCRKMLKMAPTPTEMETMTKCCLKQPGMGGFQCRFMMAAVQQQMTDGIPPLNSCGVPGNEGPSRPSEQANIDLQELTTLRPVPLDEKLGTTEQSSDSVILRGAGGPPRVENTILKTVDNLKNRVEAHIKTLKPGETSPALQAILSDFNKLKTDIGTNVDSKVAEVAKSYIETIERLKKQNDESEKSSVLAIQKLSEVLLQTITSMKTAITGALPQEQVVIFNTVFDKLANDTKAQLEKMKTIISSKSRHAVVRDSSIGEVDGLLSETDETKVPKLDSGTASPGDSFPKVQSGFPVLGNNFPGAPNGLPGSEGSFPGPGSGFPEPESGFPEPGSGFPGPGSGFPGPGNSFPGPGNSFPGPGSGFPGPGSGFPGPGSDFQGPVTMDPDGIMICAVTVYGMVDEDGKINATRVEQYWLDRVYDSPELHEINDTEEGRNATLNALKDAVIACPKDTLRQVLDFPQCIIKTCSDV